MTEGYVTNNVVAAAWQIVPKDIAGLGDETDMCEIGFQDVVISPSEC